MFQWTCLRVFELPTVGCPDPAISVHDKPIDQFNLTYRFEKGEIVLVCHEGTMVMGYMWVCFRDRFVKECQLYIRVGEDEAVMYDAYVYPPYRGRRLFLRMLTAGLAEAGRRGRKRAYGWVESDNIPSLRTNLHLGTIVMSVYWLRFFGRFSLHWATGKPLGSRFYK